MKQLRRKTPPIQDATIPPRLWCIAYTTTSVRHNNRHKARNAISLFAPYGPYPRSGELLPEAGCCPQLFTDAHSVSNVVR